MITARGATSTPDAPSTPDADAVRCRIGRALAGSGAAGLGEDGLGGVDLEHAVLHLLDRNRGPLGSGTLMEQLQDLGYTGSEPTVGRFLRTLDRRGLTNRVSNKGRDLTGAGRQRLQELCDADSRSYYEHELLKTMRGTTYDQVMDVLVARRALEREAVRLAAERATAEEIAQLEAVIQEQRESLARSGSGADADVKFHTLLAQAGHNRVVAAAVELIRRDKQLAVLLDAMLKRTRHKWVVGHEEIVAAVKQRDPDAAEKAMVVHLNDVIADVKRYRGRLRSRD
jgi:GntR family transcriptional regulator, transcriptional repressor for pyruvate dehydrogenase complex